MHYDFKSENLSFCHFKPLKNDKNANKKFDIDHELLKEAPEIGS